MPKKMVLMANMTRLEKEMIFKRAELEAAKDSMVRGKHLEGEYGPRQQIVDKSNPNNLQFKSNVSPA